MGNYCIVIEGVGQHHNGDYEKDADRLAELFVEQLRNKKHTITHASFTHGGKTPL